MPLIRYSSNGFPHLWGALLQGDHDLDLSWSQMVWSAISVGRAELMHLVRHGAYSFFEIAYRSCILFANLREGADRRIRRSSAYDGLDPSEKSAISYFLGLTMTKAFAEARLSVPWLMHLDVYRHDLNVVLQGASRPDLVGETANGAWVVMESKGRTNGFSSRALSDAKTQARQILTIDGQIPLFAVGLLTHFGGGALALAVEDPKSDNNGKQLRIPLDHEKLLRGYYRPFQVWLLEAPGATDEVIGNVPYRIAALSDLDIRVGMATRLVQTDDFSAVRPIREVGVSEENRYLGTDGLMVEVGPSWAEENMRLEPQERPG